MRLLNGHQGSAMADSDLVKISDTVWKIKADSNLFFVKLSEPVVIDTGNRIYRQSILENFPKIALFDSIRSVIFTHLHYDHIGNFDLFKNARFYASKKEIQCYKRDPYGTVLSREILRIFNVRLEVLPMITGLKYIPTPGHTAGSVCILYEKDGILFSGDTVFGEGSFGRLDLPTSKPELMKGSLQTISGTNYKVLCPGHDYCL